MTRDELLSWFRKQPWAESIKPVRVSFAGKEYEAVEYACSDAPFVFCVGKAPKRLHNQRTYCFLRGRDVWYIACKGEQGFVLLRWDCPDAIDRDYPFRWARVSMEVRDDS